VLSQPRPAALTAAWPHRPTDTTPHAHAQVLGGGELLRYKLRAMLASGILVVANSDDPAYFGAYLNANYEFLAGVASLDAQGLAQLARNSFTASFIPDEQKQAAYAAVDAALDAWQRGQQQQQPQLQQQQVASAAAAAATERSAASLRRVA
jgi:adenosine deaminase